MSDIAATPRPLGSMPGDMAMSRLADRLAALAPQEPLNLTAMQATSMPRPTPAAALATTTAIAARAAERARRSRSVTGLLIDGFVSVCALVPYALVALVLRLVMARVFFLDGQARVDGPLVPLSFQDFSFSLVLPAQMRPEAIVGFFTSYPPLPVPPALIATVVTYAELLLPILLVVGLATRFAALSLLVLTVVLQLYVMPQALWTAHIYWAAALLVLLSQGPGLLSLDALIRFLARR